MDKLDKITWAEVKKEMVEQKGLSSDVADQIGEYVRHSGDIYKMLHFLKSDPKLAANENVKAGLDDTGLLISYLEAFDVVSKVSFDLSLARGLDYYSGLIFEVITKPPIPDKEVTPSSDPRARKETYSSQVGSIAAGGRYDNLVGMFARSPIPCVGISFGVDRIFTILDARREKRPALLTREVDVYVMAADGKDLDGLLLERMAVTRALWKAGIRAEFSAKVKPKFAQQVKAAKGVSLAVILRHDELAAGQVRLKSFNVEASETNAKDQGQLILKENLVAEVKGVLGLD